MHGIETINRLEKLAADNAEAQKILADYAHEKPSTGIRIEFVYTDASRDINDGPESVASSLF